MADHALFDSCERRLRAAAEDGNSEDLCLRIPEFRKEFDKLRSCLPPAECQRLAERARDILQWALRVVACRRAVIETQLRRVPVSCRYATDSGSRTSSWNLRV